MEPKKVKLVLYFEELEKGMVLNVSNIDVLSSLTGTDETDSWTGTKLELYNDPNGSST